MIPLTVIIPFFNTGEYLKRTTESLFNQTLDGIEYIFVNDGSTDNSKDIILDVLSAYPNKNNNVRIVNSCDSGENCGIARARQAGLDLARGRYVTFCDSDDWVDKTYYEELYNAGVLNNARIVTGDHCTESVNGVSIKIAPDIKDWNDLNNYDKWFHLSLCNRIIDNSLIKNNKIRFFENINFSEDYGFLMRTYFYSSNNCNVHSDTFYHYNKMNNDSLTTAIKPASLFQRIECLTLLDEFFFSKCQDTKGCFIHNFEKFYAKESLLSINEYSLWRKKFPEVWHLVFQDQNRSMLYKCIYMLSQKISWRILWLYHNIGKLTH